MEALGLIETKGLVVAIESADAMLKAADVTLINKTNVGGGLVTIMVTGEVSAVKAAVEAGTAAIRQINSTFIISQHVIPRPDEELDSLILSTKPAIDEETGKKADTETLEDQLEAKKDLTFVTETVEDSLDKKTLEEKDGSEKINPLDNLSVEENQINSLEVDTENLHKNMIDQLVLKHGLEYVIEKLSQLRVVSLRRIVREYKGLGIAGRTISKADKNRLLEWINQYYNKQIE